MNRSYISSLYFATIRIGLSGTNCVSSNVKLQNRGIHILGTVSKSETIFFISYSDHLQAWFGSSLDHYNIRYTLISVYLTKRCFSLLAFILARIVYPSSHSFLQLTLHLYAAPYEQIEWIGHSLKGWKRAHGLREGTITLPRLKQLCV